MGYSPWGHKELDTPGWLSTAWMFSNIKNGSQTVQNRKELWPCPQLWPQGIKIQPDEDFCLLSVLPPGLLSSERPRPTRTCLASCRSDVAPGRGASRRACSALWGWLLAPAGSPGLWFAGLAWSHFSSRTFGMVSNDFFCFYCSPTSPGHSPMNDSTL